MSRRRWTMEEKAAIVMEVLTTSTSMSEICRKYNVHPTMVYKWKESFVQSGTKGLAGKDASGREKQLEMENHKLKEMIADLALANELLKKGRLST
jgi:transposase-like protein